MEQKALTPEDAIDIVEKTWRWYSEGQVVMPNKITTDMSTLGVDGWFNSMPAYIGPMKTAGIKLVGGYGKNKSIGLPYIKALVGPYADVRFMPTGGISPANLVSYLSCPAVFCCGGTWMVKEDLIGEGRFDEVERLCREAVELMKDVRG